VELRAEPVRPEETRPLRHAVLRPHETPDQLAAREAPDAYYAGVRFEGEIVAVGRIRPDGGPGAWRINGMATAPARRGRGFGSLVLEELLRHARARGATRVWCTGRAEARRFYERHGLVVESEAHDDPATGVHHLMALSWPRA
jgi:GNAT superfamily N-acetyltransferase